MPSISPTISLQSSDSSVSSCSDFSVDANSDGRGYLEECSPDSSREESSYDLKQHSNGSGTTSQPNGVSRDADSVGSVQRKEAGDLSVKMVDGGTETSPYSDETDAHFWIPPEPEDFEDEVEGSITNYDDDDECGDGMTWGKSSSLSSLGEEVSGSDKLKEEKQRTMEDVMNGRFKTLVDQLLKSVGVVSLGKDGQSWLDIVTSLSWEAATFVKPDATEGNTMDPDGYVKIKCVATGSPSQSQVIKGLVFKKHAAHKHMPTKYKNPRLLLVQGALGLSPNGLSSFESMQQEKDSLKAIIDVIEMYQPNVVLVEKTVSRDVQELILVKGMTLVLDMKLHRLERVARCTGSPILSSDILVGQKLRQCDSFHFEKFVEDLTSSGEGGKRPSKTLMFLEGCPTRLGCTILLMGTNSDQLKKIKCVVRCAVVMAHHFILETYFLLDQKAMFSTIPLSQVMNLALKTEESLPLGSGGLATSCNGDHVAESDATGIVEIPVSNGFLEEGPQYLRPDPNANSSFSFGSYNPTILSGLSSLSASLRNIMEESFPLFSNSQSAVSPYYGLYEKKQDDQGQADIQVTISPEAVDQYETEPKLTTSEEKERANWNPNPTSTSNNAHLDTQNSNGDYEEHIHNKDNIKAVLDSESILVLLSSRNSSRGTMCDHNHFSHIKFYRNFDVPLGKFLRDNLLSQKLQCKTCGEPPQAHFYYYAHHNKQLTIQVRHLPTGKSLPGESEGKLWMWSRCGKCKSNNGSSRSTKRVLISTAARGLSFGKFLELSFSNPSSFSTKSSCGHSLHKDFLYFFGLGPMVAMLKHSKVVTYSVALPPQKLEFGNSVNGEFLKKEFENVYMKGILMFLDVEKSLKEIQSRFIGMTLNLQGSRKEFSYIEDMLKQERRQFEVDIQNAVTNGNEDEAVYKLLRLNRVRLELLLESFVWDRRLHSLSSSDLSALDAKIIDNGMSEQVHEGTTQLQDDVKDIAIEGGENTSVHDTKVDHKLDTFVEANHVQIKDIPFDGLSQRSLEHVGSLSSSACKDIRRVASENVLLRSDTGIGLQDNPRSIAGGQSDKIYPITIDIGGSTLDSNTYQSGKSLFRSLFNTENGGASIWTPFSEIQQEYFKDLWRGYAPKFDSICSLALDTNAYKLITDEGSRLHIPLGAEDFIVSDYEDEFSSIIACALALLKDLANPQDLDEEARKEKGIDVEAYKSSQSLPRIFSLNSRHLSSSGSLDFDGLHSSTGMSLEESHFSSFNSLDLLDSLVSLGAVHPEVSMGIGKLPGKRKYSVICLCANQFRQLRNRCCPSEVDYIASLSRCRNWDAKGGKSKSFFAKTLDDRFIIKEIKRTEFESFMEFAQNYFDYMNECYELGNQTCLAKILGIYQVIIRQPKNGKETRHDLMVMENLSFGWNISRQYDLKGALHARFTSAGNGAGDILLDQNFVNDMNVSPLYVSRKSKRNLQRAVWNDTTFLHNINVMDYSLLVGVDEQKRELVCGIIDYLRQYTWDKQLENWVKSSLVIPKNQLPTVISPREYKKRFRKFIDTHFLTVPDRWCSQRSNNPCRLCGMGDDADCSNSKSHEEEENGEESNRLKPQEGRDCNGSVHSGKDKQNGFPA